MFYWSLSALSQCCGICITAWHLHRDIVTWVTDVSLSNSLTRCLSFSLSYSLSFFQLLYTFWPINQLVIFLNFCHISMLYWDLFALISCGYGLCSFAIQLDLAILTLLLFIDNFLELSQINWLPLSYCHVSDLVLQPESWV